MLKTGPGPHVKAAAMLAAAVVVTGLFVAALEGWGIFDGIYAMFISVSTIGLGDLAPKTFLGRVITVAFALSFIRVFHVAIDRFSQTVHEEFTYRVQLVRQLSRFRSKMAVSALFMAGLVFVATLFFMIFEGWGFTDSWFYVFSSVSTIGYGDLSPQTFLGKLWTIIVAIAGLGATAMLSSAIADSIIRHLYQDADSLSNHRLS